MSLRHRIAAAGDLLQRYRTVFSHCWQRRDTLKHGFFNKQEAEFLPAGLALQESPDSPTLRWTGRILACLVACAVLWSVLGKVDIVVNAGGKVVSSSRIKTIGSIDVASVKALHVSEGQAVRAGDLLIELDSTSSDAEHDKATEAIAHARLQVARSRALIEAVQQLRAPRLDKVEAVSRVQWLAAQRQLDSQWMDFSARLTRIDGEIARYADALPLATQRAADYQALIADQTVSRHAWLEREQARVDLEGQLRDARNQRTALIAQTRKDAYTAIADGDKIIAAVQQDRRRAGERSKLLKLTAPVDGTVQQLTVHTVGGVVPAAQPLMQIAPDGDTVEVEAFIENRDVGFVREGQSAEVKIDAFNYTKYGTVPATVAHVSRDAIQDQERGPIYATRISLSRDDIVVDGESVPLSAGMAVNVEIKTGTRRVIEYVLSPLIRHRREALNER